MEELLEDSESSEAWRTKHITLSSLTEVATTAFSTCSEFAEHLRLRNSWAFSHTTALALLGIELPRIKPSFLKPFPEKRKKYSLSKIHICFSKKGDRSQSQSAVMHLWTPDFVPRIVGENIHCVPPVTAWAQMSKYVEFDELVVLGDSMMRKDVRLKQASLDDFAQFIQNSPRFIGKGKCVRAVPLLAENTDSSQESRLRLLLMHRHLGRPEVNYAVYDRENQQRYLLDLAYPSHHVALEYDGEQHAIDKVQRRNDIFKRNQLEQMGWTVITAYKEDLVESDRVELLVSKILLAFARQST